VPNGWTLIYPISTAYLVVEVEDSVEARGHVEVVLAAVFAEPLGGEPRLLEPPTDLLRIFHHP